MAKVNWVVKGKLSLADLPSIYTEGKKTVPLSGVTLKIYANEGIRWNSWGTVTTDNDGKFYLRKKKDKSKRKFKIEVQFKNSKTVVYGENKNLLSKLLKGLTPVKLITQGATAALEAILTHTSRATYKSDFHVIKEESTRTDGKGKYVFSYDFMKIKKSSAGYMWEQACIFYGAEKLRKHTLKMGHSFKHKLAVKYPHDNDLIGDKIELSYCSPLNNCVYLIKNSKRDNLKSEGEITFNTLYHELMHLWTYGYSKGEDSLAAQLVIHQSTHDGVQEKSFTAFHEAWAEFSSNMMLKEIFNETSDIYGHHDFWQGPYNKTFLKSKDIKVPGLAKMDHHEFGWMQIFQCLTKEGLANFNLELAQEYASAYARPDSLGEDTIPTLDIYDLMKVFRVPEPYKKTDMNLSDFMDRVKKVEPEFNASVRAGYIKVFDVNDSTHPRDCFS